ncbi:MAG: Nif3-like dinuclear metal center hexameric protein [Bacillaceae bacterium]
MGKDVNGFQVISVFESLFPKHLAMEGDKIGLQIGTLNKPVQNVLVALDVTPEVVQEAIDGQVDLIIAHHPLIFNPLKAVTTDSTYGKIVEACIKHDIAVYAAHTNVDIADGGVNDLLAEALELENVDMLLPTYEEKTKKLVVFVPTTHVDEVKEAIAQAGGGHIGNYSHCSFSLEGEGNFKALEGTTPFIGSEGEVTSVKEVRIETIITASQQRRVVSAMLKAHPYEEVAYDIYPLENKGPSYGLGRIGTLKEEMTLEQFALFVKEKLDVQGVRVAGNKADKVKKVAVVGGDGNKYFRTAKFKGADVYVTGDIYYHVAHDALLEGMNIVDPGHNVEKVMKKGVQVLLEQKMEENKWNVKVMASALHTDPFQFM